MREYFGQFQRETSAILDQYFRESEGVVPRSLDDLFGESGLLTRTFASFFDPASGRVPRLIEQQVGPSSKFAQALDPNNKQGVIALIEKRVGELIEAKLEDVLAEFSLDHDDSAMSRLRGMLASFFGELRQALGVQEGHVSEAQRGHVKGFDFEADLYEPVAEWGRQLGDDTQLVRGTPGILKRKTGDHLVILGEATGAPGLKIVVEAKEQPYRLKDAVDELQQAKENRNAVCGIFAFAKGCEPCEGGDFRRIGEDFYCTVDKDSLSAGGPLPYIETAYKIARVQAVATARKEAAGKLDFDRVEQHIDALLKWVPRLGEIATKANTIQNNGRHIEDTANKVRSDMDDRLKEILELLRRESD